MKSQLNTWYQNSKEWIIQNHLRIGRLFMLIGIGIAFVLTISLLESYQMIFFLFALLCIGIGYEMLIRYLEEARVGMENYVQLKEKENAGYNILDALKEK